METRDSLYFFPEHLDSIAFQLFSQPDIAVVMYLELSCRRGGALSPGGKTPFSRESLVSRKQLRRVPSETFTGFLSDKLFRTCFSLPKILLRVNSRQETILSNSSCHSWFFCPCQQWRANWEICTEASESGQWAMSRAAILTGMNPTIVTSLGR